MQIYTGWYKAIWVSIWIVVLERMIVALKGGEEYASGMGV